MGLISNVTAPKKINAAQTKLPLLDKDFFITVRLALEHTNWEPDDAPIVKKVASQLGDLVKFFQEVWKLSPAPAKPAEPPSAPLTAETEPGADSKPATPPETTPPAPEQKKNRAVDGVKAAGRPGNA